MFMMLICSQICHSVLRHLIASLTNCICTDVPVSYSRIKDARYGFLHNKPPLSTLLFSCDCGNFRKILKIGIYVVFFSSSSLYHAVLVLQQGDTKYIFLQVFVFLLLKTRLVVRVNSPKAVISPRIVFFHSARSGPDCPRLIFFLIGLIVVLNRLEKPSSRGRLGRPRIW